MKLSISNIAFDNTEVVYLYMKELGYAGLEIAPTKIIPQQPYGNVETAKTWAKKLKAEFGLDVCSMQSIWYGRTEQVFGSVEERDALVDYTKRAIDFANAIGCKNLVFGNPKNRNTQNASDYEIALEFFKEIGDYAYAHDTCIGMEANPAIYNTYFVNATSDALKLIADVKSKGFMLNLDIGTMIVNEESVAVLQNAVGLVNHVHVSEPFLKQIEKRELHFEVARLLKQNSYENFVSIEMGKLENVEDVKQTMQYVKEVFG